MTKASANPRRYSRGPEGLDPNLPLNVYMSVRVEPQTLDAAIGRLEYLAEKHPAAALDIASYTSSHGRIHLTLEIGMGPARAALRGTGLQLQAGYALLWDIVKTLFYAQPVFCGPPSAEERAYVDSLGVKPKLNRSAEVSLQNIAS